MKYYYLYLPTANLFAHSELQDVRDDYFFIGHFSDEDKANRMVAIKANQYCCRNDYALELMLNAPHPVNRKKYHHTTDYKQLLAEQILLRKKLQEQFRNERTRNI